MSHKFAQQMLQYAHDAMLTSTPWELWSVSELDSDNFGYSWTSCTGPITWAGHDYKRRNMEPKIVKIVSTICINYVCPRCVCHNVVEQHATQLITSVDADCVRCGWSVKLNECTNFIPEKC